MEVPGMDEAKKAEGHMSSAAAFVEGGIQEACDDACSICLEGFCDSDPSTLTTCKHEFHLQCILEWCQRSSNCPMCWQNIVLKDPSGQELLEAVAQERSLRLTPSRNATRFHYPTFGDIEVQHLPAGMGNAELEERIIQHLAAAAAMGRSQSHRISRRESGRHRSSSHDREFVVFPTHPNESFVGSGGEETEPVAVTRNNTPVPHLSMDDEGAEIFPSSVQNHQIPAASSGSLGMAVANRRISNDNRTYVSQSSLPNQDRAGPSEFQPFSDTWKSRFSSLSMKYKESISKSTKEWKEKLFSRSTSMAGIGSDVRREVNAGIASVSRMMERLENRDNERAGHEPLQNNALGSSVTERTINNRVTPEDVSTNGNSAPFSAANSHSG